MQIAILGLGKMGKLIAEKILADGHELVVWNRSKDVLDEIRTEKAESIISQKLAIVHSIDELRNILRKPRVIWSMLPAGEPTETILQQINEFTESGDVVIDGGNSNYKDTQRRYDEFSKKGIKFMGIGVSGGVHALENGCCMMVGGDRDAYQYIVPVLDSLAKPNGIHTYFGHGGAGHFVKMVHNGIEYGMMQAIGEGFGVLGKSDYQLNLLDVANTWQGGSIVSSFLLDMVIDALGKDPVLSQTEGYINANGEGKWTVETAKEQNVPVPVIEQSLEFRNRSQYDELIQKSFVAKVVQAMRHEFGGHEVTKPVTVVDNS